MGKGGKWVERKSIRQQEADKNKSVRFISALEIFSDQTDFSFGTAQKTVQMHQHAAG
jgi:hypothetical protein